MQIPPADIDWFAETFGQASGRILEAWDDNGLEQSSNEPDPEMLCGAIRQLTDLLKSRFNGGVMATAETHQPAVMEADISELGDYGLNILSDLSLISADLGIVDENNTWELLAVSLARWLGANGAELHSLDLVVNGFSFLANRSTDIKALESLFMAMGEITEAMVPVGDPVLEGDVKYPEAGAMLLLNRGIVATRIHSPHLMESAFTDIAELIPEMAPRFFQEGLEQIDLINYPPQVRVVIQRFARDWPEERVLH
ncbi:MAG: hypothetical protein ABW082_17635 [Sedimenticola sp.]